MSKHTPEPWVVDEANPELVARLDSSGVYRYIACFDPNSFANSEHTQEEDEGNAARAVACVNACAGINPEAVPDLLRVCKAAREDERICRKCFDVLGAALAKAVKGD